MHLPPDISLDFGLKEAVNHYVGGAICYLFQLLGLDETSPPESRRQAVRSAHHRSFSVAEVFSDKRFEVTRLLNARSSSEDRQVDSGTSELRQIQR